MPLGSHSTIIVRERKTSAGLRWRAECYVRDLDGKRRRVERWGESAAKAKRKLQQALAERTIPTAGGLNGRSKLSDAVELWFADVRQRRAATTLDTYRQRYESLVKPALGDLRLQEINVSLLDGFMQQLARRSLSAATRKNVRSVLSGALGLAVRHGAIRTNPVRDLARLETTDRQSVRALSEAELADFLAKLDADPVARRRDLPSLIRFLVGTGCRIGEALAVRWCDVDLDNGMVSINGNVVPVRGRGLVRHSGKTAAARRTIALPASLVSMLRARITEDADPAEPVFPSSVLSWRDPIRIGKWIREARTAAGYDWVTSHTFRRTTATLLDQRKFTPRQVADLLGHTRPSITQDAYFGRTPGDPEAAAALDAVLDGKS